MEVKTKKNILFYIMVIVFVGFVIFPFLWQFMTSVKPLDEINKMPPVWIPSKVNTQFYINVFTKRPFARYLLNSFIVASCTTLFSIAAGSACAYALARLRFKGKNVILASILTISMFPAIATVSPLFIFLKNMKLLNTYSGLVLPYTTFALPLTIWILTNFFREIPKGLEEAAVIDGCFAAKAFIRIILPLAAPGIFAAALLTFITAWNEFLYGLTFMTSDSMRTVPVAISLFPGKYDLPWGDMAAASIVVTVPLIILVLLFQKHVIAGLTAGGVKE